MSSSSEKAALVLGGAAAAVGIVALLQRAQRYSPHAVWTESPGSASMKGNRSTAGARTEVDLPVGKHPLQLYSLATPNGVKVTILLEELCDLDPDFEYDAWKVGLGGDQFGSGFVGVNPNSKIPAMLDRSSKGAGGSSTRIFESVAIMMHVAEVHGKGQFLPTAPAERAECLSWLFWQVGSAPYLGGGFGHFYNYANVKQEYPIDRFAMEVKRQLDVLDQRLAGNAYLCGDTYTLADMAVWPWYGALVLGRLYGAAEFLQVAEYANVIRWAKLLDERPAVQRGRMVNRSWGADSCQLAERHSRADFDRKHF